MQVVNSLCRRLKGRIAVTAVLGAVQLGQPAGVAAQNNDLANEAQKIINEVRSRVPDCSVVSANAGASGAVKVGLSTPVPARPQLQWNAKLAHAAQKHSQSMATQSYFDHVDPQGKGVAQRANETGYRFRVVSENIAAGQENLNEAIMEWIASPGHCANMLDARVTEFGLARVDSPNPGDPYTSYWTLVMGSQR
jgi:Cysteine-rich secretory protein family